jgi:hypothetical protein
MRNFLLGEKKELGIKINAASGVDFKITGARYEYFDRRGNLLGSGEATVEGRTVYTELTPTVLGWEQYVTFIVTIQSDDERYGTETVRQDVVVNVMEDPDAEKVNIE